MNGVVHALEGCVHENMLLRQQIDELAAASDADRRLVGQQRRRLGAVAALIAPVVTVAA